MRVKWLALETLSCTCLITGFVFAQNTSNGPSVESLLAAGRYRDALAELQLSSPTEKQTGRWHFLASKAYDGLNDPQKAVQEAENALAVNPRDESYHLQLGQIFLSRSTPQAAVDIFSSALLLFPASLPLRLGRGIALMNLGHYEEAESDFQTCLQKQPGLGIAFESLETVYLQSSRPELAAQTANSYRQRHPDDHRGHYFFAAAHEQMERDSQLEQAALQEALRCKPDYVPAKVLQAKIALRSGDAARALTLLEESVRLRPEYAPAHVELAKTYRTLGRNNEAAQELQVLQRLSDARPRSLAYHRGSGSSTRQ